MTTRPEDAEKATPPAAEPGRPPLPRRTPDQTRRSPTSAVDEQHAASWDAFGSANSPPTAGS